MPKRVVFIADSLDNAYKFQQILAEFDVEVAAGSTAQMRKLLTSGSPFDLVIFEARGSAIDDLDLVETLAEDTPCNLLLIIDSEDVEAVQFPPSIRSDFVVHGASAEECSVRVRRLLDDGMVEEQTDSIVVDNMVINLATYQVTVAGAPVDLTYLEYALLAFLVRHPGHTFSRDALLQHVWGFDYFGGSRTVDVHVRRIRAKLGPELAQRLETVRGVGYLWSL